jgi:hypothetical protein
MLFRCALDSWFNSLDTTVGIGGCKRLPLFRSTITIRRCRGMTGGKNFYLTGEMLIDYYVRELEKCQIFREICENSTFGDESQALVPDQSLFNRLKVGLKSSKQGNRGASRIIRDNFIKIWKGVNAS